MLDTEAIAEAVVRRLLAAKQEQLAAKRERQQRKRRLWAARARRTARIMQRDDLRFTRNCGRLLRLVVVPLGLFLLWDWLR